MTQNRTNESLSFAIFAQTDQAEQAVEALHDAGFTTDQVRYSRQFTGEDFLANLKAMLIFPDERQDESESDMLTMLQNMGISQEEIQYYTDAYANGSFVVIVRPDGRNQDAERILRDNNGAGYRGQ